MSLAFGTVIPQFFDNAMAAVARRNRIGPGVKHQPSRHPGAPGLHTMRPASPPLWGVGPLQARPQIRWSSPGAARRIRETIPARRDFMGGSPRDGLGRSLWALT